MFVCIFSSMMFFTRYHFSFALTFINFYPIDELWPEFLLYMSTSWNSPCSRWIFFVCKTECTLFFLSLFLLCNSLNLARIPSKVARCTFKNYVSQTQVQDQNRLQFQWNTTASICNYPNTTALFKYASLFKRMMTSLWFVHGPQNSPNINGYHVNIEMKIVYHSGEHYLKPNCFERNRQSDWLTMKSHRIFIGVWKTRLKSFCPLQGKQNRIFSLWGEYALFRCIDIVIHVPW